MKTPDCTISKQWDELDDLCPLIPVASGVLPLVTTPSLDMGVSVGRIGRTIRDQTGKYRSM